MRTHKRDLLRCIQRHNVTAFLSTSLRFAPPRAGFFLFVSLTGRECRQVWEINIAALEFRAVGLVAVADEMPTQIGQLHCGAVLLDQSGNVQSALPVTARATDFEHIELRSDIGEGATGHGIVSVRRIVSRVKLAG